MKTKFKKIICVMLGIALILDIASCKKEQSRFDKVTILEKTGEKFRELEDYIDVKRSSPNPVSYDTLADYCYNAIVQTMRQELKPDSGLKDKGDIAKVVKVFLAYHRETHWGRHRKADKDWNRLRVGCEDDAYRVLQKAGIGEKLLKALHEYLTKQVVSNDTGGERIESMENDIRDLVISNGDDAWALREYFKNFAKDAKNKAEGKKQGFLNFGWFDGQGRVRRQYLLLGE